MFHKSRLFDFDLVFKSYNFIIALLVRLFNKFQLNRGKGLVYLHNYSIQHED